MEFKQYTFKPNETIQGAIRFLNKKNFSDKELITLMYWFNQKNNHQIPYVGGTYFIPIEESH